MPLNLEASTIQAALEQHVPSCSLEDETTREYLESLLQDEDSYDDPEALVDVITPFLDDDQQVAQNLVQAILGLSKGNSSTEKPKGPANPVVKASVQVQVSEPDKDHHSDDSSSHDASEGEKGVKSHAAMRKEKQRQKREQRRKKSKSPKGKKALKNAANATQDKTDANTENTETDLQSVVTRLQKQSVQQLDEMDDYASAWKEVKDGDGKKLNPAVWGGRGYGGRGVNRGQGVYRGKDAVVQNLTLSYGGKDLLSATHLAISHGHRYGLMGPNGVGKSTLLRRIATGSVPGWPLHLSVQMVEQEVLGSPQTVRECMQQVKKECGENGAGNNSQRRLALEEEQAKLEAVLEDANAEPEATEAAAERLSEIYDQLEAMDNNEDDSSQDETENMGGFAGLDKRAKTILKGLQFQTFMLDTPGNQLSGGWRMRVALATVLYSQPDILLLDEPTNHLDLSAILFLEEWILQEDLTIIVVSHDGSFLDAVCTDMIKFQDAKLKYHVGNFSHFQQSEEQMWARNTKKAEAAAKKEKKALEFIQKQKSMANSKHRDDNKQRQAAERQKKLGRIGLFSENGQKFKLLAEGNTKNGGSNRAGHIFGNYTNARGMQSAFVSNEKVAFGDDRRLLNFKFPAAQPLKGGGGGNQPFITMEDGNFRYDNDKSAAWLLQDMSLNVSYGSRIAIVGKNGAGKSTLLKILCSELELSKGEFHRHPNVKIAHIAQHHIEHLGNFLECTPVEYFLKQHHAKNEQEARKFLGDFGLVGPLALQQIGTLSGGQKARLAFATVMYVEPHLLILDEPTNHLDRDSLESLAVAVEKFSGGVVIVSHNQDFLSRCANEMWTVANGRVKVEVADGEATTFDDLFENYKNSLRKESRKKK